jgi:hypothetical protein
LVLWALAASAETALAAGRRGNAHGRALAAGVEMALAAGRGGDAHGRALAAGVEMALAAGRGGLERHGRGRRRGSEWWREEQTEATAE